MMRWIPRRPQRSASPWRAWTPLASMIGTRRVRRMKTLGAFANWSSASSSRLAQALILVRCGTARNGNRQWQRNDRNRESCHRIVPELIDAVAFPQYRDQLGLENRNGPCSCPAP